MNQTAALCDLSFLDNFTKGDKEKMERYIQTYLRTSVRIFGELEQAGRQADWEEAYIKAHTVKPQVQYMGIKSLLALILEIEDRAKNNPGAEGLDELVEKALDLYERSAAELLQYLQELNSQNR